MRLGGLHLRSKEGKNLSRLHFFIEGKMHLLYLDDSGSAPNPNEQYFVLGGISVFEAQAHWFTQELDRLAESISPNNPHDIEFHASEIFSRRSAPWNKMSRQEAQGVIKSLLQIVAGSYGSAQIFACAIHKASFPDRDPVEIAFEDLCSRFDQYLAKLRDTGDRQRGLLILDDSAHETTLQNMARGFRVIGTRWGVIRNLAETPLFVSSNASRLVQIADHIAYATFRRYEAGDTQYFDIIAQKFYAKEGIIHGLAHKQMNNQSCMCIACLSRRFASGQLSTLD